MDGSTFFVTFIPFEPRTIEQSMQVKEQLNRAMTDMLFEKQDVETTKPNKPLVEPKPQQPKPGQIILTDEKH